jgi:hypothetical protein
MSSGFYALWGAIVGAIAGTAGALITGYFVLKSKQTELWFVRKVDAYQKALNLAGTFALDPTNQEKYLPFIGAANEASVVASPAVNGLLNNPREGSLSLAAAHLRMAKEDERLGLQMGEWYDTMERVAKAMREDVANVARTKDVLASWRARSG